MASRSTSIPAPPIPLAGPALDKWRQCATTTMPERTVTNLAAYCAAYGRWVQAEQWLADPEHGPVVTIRDDKGNVKSHGPAPQLRIAEQASKEMSRLAAAAGVNRF